MRVFKILKALKNVSLKACLTIGLSFFINHIYSQNTKELKLWYNQPAGNVWESALPLGNGFQAAMVYGNVEKDIFQLNEGTVWSGSPNRNDNPKAKENLKEIQNLLFQGEYKAAERLVNEAIITKKSHGQKFQPVGNLELSFPNHENYTNYYRELNIENAVCKTSYKVNDVEFTRESFVSLTDRVLVIQLKASKPEQLSFSINFSSKHEGHTVIVDTNELSLQGKTSSHQGVEGKVKFNALAKVKTNGGSIEASEQSIKIQKAYTVTIYAAIASNFIDYNDISGDEKLKAKQFLDEAFKKDFLELKVDHIAKYQNYFNRVNFKLEDSNFSNLTTDERLKQFRNNHDPAFVALYYQFGRYLLISSSQPGGQPANLQGIWNGSMSPAWDSKYTININTEMNYWPAEKTNLSEMHQPLFSMVKDLAVTGQQTAKNMYGARGWVAHHNTDIWRFTGAIDGATWGVWNGGGAWLSQHLWEHYLYSGDKTFLENNYDILKGAAQFYVDFLVKHPKYGWLVVAPGNSPENTPSAHQGSAVTAGSTMDNQLVFDVFSNAINASKILKKDRKFANSLKALIQQLPPMQIGKHNQLQEWLDDVDSPEDKHRHISHLYGLYPSNQISAYQTPLLFAAAKNTLLQRGDVSTGWSMGWKVNWWAKMQDGNHAYKLIKNQLTPVGINEGGGGTYNNLFDAHPPFQIDGNFGCTSGITEMLIQSSNGEVHILPALPDAFKNSGEIKGIKTRGGFEIVLLSWKDGKLEHLEIQSHLGGNLRLRVPTQVMLHSGKKLKKAKGDNSNVFFTTPKAKTPLISKKSNISPLPLAPTYTYDIKTKKGKTYKFTTTTNNN